jgi:AcrR family transcriptional regulator
MAATSSKPRIPAAQRRDALIDAAVEEFAHGGLHATPVDRIARRVGVAQPYVFSLFPTKRDLFIAALESCFRRVGDLFVSVDPSLKAIGDAYVELLGSDRTLLTMQLHAYSAACADPVIAEHVRNAYRELIERVRERTGASSDQLEVFSANGFWLTINAAMGVPDLAAACDWMERTRSEFDLPYEGRSDASELREA